MAPSESPAAQSPPSQSPAQSPAPAPAPAPEEFVFDLAATAKRNAAPLPYSAAAPRDLGARLVFQWLCNLDNALGTAPASVLAAHHPAVCRSLSLFLAPPTCPAAPSPPIRRLVAICYLRLLASPAVPRSLPADVMSDALRALSASLAPNCCAALVTSPSSSSSSSSAPSAALQSAANTASTSAAANSSSPEGSFSFDLQHSDFTVPQQATSSILLVASHQVHLIGRLAALLSNYASHLLAEATSTLLRVLRISGVAASLRVEALVALSRTVRYGPREVTPAICKELTKLLRIALADQSLSVRRAAATCYSTLIASCQIARPTSVTDLDATVAVFIKSLESSCFLTRLRLARALACVLASTQEHLILALHAQSDNNQLSGENPSSTNAAVAAAVAAATGGSNANSDHTQGCFSFAEMISCVSVLKTNMRCVQVGLAETCCVLFQVLGSGYTKAYFLSFFAEFVATPVSTMKFRNLSSCDQTATKQLMLSALRNILKMLSEPDVHFIIRTICEKYLNSDSAFQDKWLIHVVFSFLADTLEDLQDVSTVSQDLPVSHFLQILCTHRSHLVHVAGARLLAQFILHSPTHFVSVLQLLHGILARDVPILCRTNSSSSAHVVSPIPLPKIFDVQPSIDASSVFGFSIDIDSETPALGKTSLQSPECRRYMGVALALSTLMNVSQHVPLYVPSSSCSMVFSLATSLLAIAHKSDGSPITQSVPKNLFVTEIAWTLITGILAATNEDAKLHLPPIIIMWRAYLPRFFAGTQNIPSTPSLLAEFLIARECVLRSILALLLHNKDILSNQDLQQIAANVCTAASTLESIISQRGALGSGLASCVLSAQQGVKHGQNPSSQQPSPTSSPSLTASKKTWNSNIHLKMAAHLYCKRLFEISSLLPLNLIEPVSTLLLNSGLAMLTGCADADTDTPLGTTPTQLPYGAAFWNATGHTLTTLPVSRPAFDKWYTFRNSARRFLAGPTVFDTDLWAPFEAVLFHPWVFSFENDILSVYHWAQKKNQAQELDFVQPVTTTQEQNDRSNLEKKHLLASQEFIAGVIEPVAPFIASTNAAILLCARIFAQSSASIKQTILTNASTELAQKTSTATQKGKREALLINFMVMLYVATEAINADVSALSSLDHGVAQSMVEMAALGLDSNDGGIRHLAAQVIGRATKFGGGGASALVSVHQFLSDAIQRDPKNTRFSTGAALALSMAHVHTRSTAMISKTVSLIAQALASTELDTVRQGWLVYALCALLESCGVDGAQNSADALIGLVFLLMRMETQPSVLAPRLLCGCIDALGPELQSLEGVSTLVAQMTRYFMNCCSDDEPTMVVAHAWRGMSHLQVMHPRALSVAYICEALCDILARLRTTKTTPIASSMFVLHNVLDCLCQVTQQHPRQVAQGVPDVALMLLKMYHLDPITIAKCLVLLIETTDYPCTWIDYCGRILDSHQQAQVPIFEASTALACLGQDSSITENLEEASGHIATVRWPSQVAAVSCLRLLLRSLVQRRANGETALAPHLEVAVARALPSLPGGESWLVDRVGDIIRVAFRASSSPAGPLRRQGLGLLEDVLNVFSGQLDPDVPGHTLLEQYQAQVGSALTPAFGSDASPLLLSRACQVCARYLCSNITDELFTLDRIIKLLTRSLDDVDGKNNTLVSEFARVITFVGVLTAWADLRISATMQSVVTPIVMSTTPKLVPLWMDFLHAYYVILLDPETEYQRLPGQFDGTATSMMLEYLVSARKAVMPEFRDSWGRAYLALCSEAGSSSWNTCVSKYGYHDDVPNILLVLISLGCFYILERSDATASENTNSPHHVSQSAENVFYNNTATRKPKNMYSISTAECLAALTKLMLKTVLPVLTEEICKTVIMVCKKVLQLSSSEAQCASLKLLDQMVLEYFDEMKDNLAVQQQIVELAIVSVAKWVPEAHGDPERAMREFPVPSTEREQQFYANPGIYALLLLLRVAEQNPKTWLNPALSVLLQCYRVVPEKLSKITMFLKQGTLHDAVWSKSKNLTVSLEAFGRSLCEITPTKGLQVQHALIAAATLFLTAGNSEVQAQVFTATNLSLATLYEASVRQAGMKDENGILSCVAQCVRAGLTRLSAPWPSYVTQISSVIARCAFADSHENTASEAASAAGAAVKNLELESSKQATAAREAMVGVLFGILISEKSYPTHAAGRSQLSNAAGAAVELHKIADYKDNVATTLRRVACALTDAQRRSVEAALG